MLTDAVALLGCGDVGPIDEPMDFYGRLVKPVLASADIRFSQCERLYSDRGTLQLHGSKHCRIPPDKAAVFSDCGFDVVSLASNHAGHWGAEALIDTIDVFHKRGIQTIGAGRNLQEARKPAIVEQNGIRVAFLSYCSVVQEGYNARYDRAGIAPLRAHTYYEARDYEPAVPPRVVSFPYEEDLQAMLEDIANVRKTVHAVVLSLHWGVHYYEKIIAEYQPIIAHAAIDAGVDLILGHRPHLVKAIEVYKGKVCFYSLGQFIMQLERPPDKKAGLMRKYGIKLDPDYPKLEHGVGSHRILVAKALISERGVQKVSCLPGMINKQLQPEVLRHGDPRFEDMVRYVEWVSEDFDHKFVLEGDEIVIEQ